VTPKSKRFIIVDYEAALDFTVSLRECLPPDLWWPKKNICSEISLEG